MPTSGISVRKDFRVLDRLIRETPDKADRMLEGAAIEITGDIVVSFGSSPSPEGGPPGVDTGALRGSMHWEKQGRLHYIVADGVIYGIYQELGTERMGARPFVGPVIEEWRARRFGAFVKEFGLIG